MTRPKKPAMKRAEQRQEDGEDDAHAQPFIRLMSSTAMEPRLRK